MYDYLLTLIAGLIHFLQILPIKPKNSTTKPIAEVDDSDDDSDEEIGDNVKKIVCYSTSFQTGIF